MSTSSEVQSHGFSWEKEILRIYGATDAEMAQIAYISKMDLPAQFNRLNGCDLSVKVSGSANLVCMADCLRVYDAVTSGTPFHMVAIFYEQDDAAGLKHVKQILEVDLTSAGEALFGSVTRAELEELVTAIRAVPQKRAPTAAERAAMYAIRNRLQPRCGAIHLDIKCNAQQSRLQCSFNRFGVFLERHAERVVARSTGAEFRGGAVTAALSSGRRVFKKDATATVTAAPTVATVTAVTAVTTVTATVEAVSE